MTTRIAQKRIHITALALLLTIGIAIATGEPYSAYATEATGKQLLTAGIVSTRSATAGSYRILFNAKGGKGVMEAQTVKRGKKVVLKANSFIRAGYEFAGWNTKKDGKGKSYKNKAKIKNLAKSGKTVTLYAQWRKSVIHELKVGKTYKKYDITGDDKVDKIVVKGAAPDAGNAGEGYYRFLKVYVNGELRLTTVDSRMTFGIYPQVKLVNLASGAPLLYVHYSTSNGYYAGGWIYRCGAKSMKRIFDTSVITSDYAKRHSDAYRVYETFVSVSMNDLRFKSGSFTTDSETYIYRYRNGKLIKR